MKFFCLALSIVAPSTGPAGINAQVNAIYERIATGARERDPLLSRRAYAPDAVFLDERRPEMQIGEDLHQSMRASMQSLAESGAQAHISYRVTRRTLSDDGAVDVGYYRVAITPRDREALPSISYRKFLLTARPIHGSWLITNDASLPSSQDAYNRARPVEGLRFDL